MQTGRLIRFIIPGIAVTVAFIISLSIRIVIPYDKIFSGGLIRFADPDCWYQLRLVDSLLYNFPRLITFDPYTYFPHGQEVFWHPLFTYVLGIPALIFGGSAAGEQLIYTVSAYIPAILGALAVIPVYFIGKIMFNRWAGIISALLIAILPGEFLHRSMLGFTDHHIAEALFIATAFLFLILAIKSAKEKVLSWESVRQSNISIITRPAIYSIMAGIFLSIYLLTWVGGLLFLVILILYFVLQFMVDHCRGISVEYLGITGGIIFLITLIISLPGIWESHYRPYYLLSLPLVFLIPPVLSLLSWFFIRRGIKPLFYPAIILFIGIMAIVLVYVVAPSFFSDAMRQFTFFTPAGVVLSITEAQPLLFPDGRFSFDFALINFSFAFFLSLITIGLLIYEAVKRKNNPEIMLVAFWSLLVLLAALGQRRFVYYYAVNVAVLCGYMAWLVFRLFGIRENDGRQSSEIQGKKDNKNRKKRPLPSSRLKIPNLIAAIVVVLVVFIYPVTGPLPRAGQFKIENVPVLNTINSSIFVADSWQHTLKWLKENTPDPFGNPDFYYNFYDPPVEGKSYIFPESAYGVIAWWDYGHMITQIAHRIPVSNPHQFGATSAALFFTSRDTVSANALLDKLKARYIIIDNATATTKFHGAIVSFADGKDEDYFEMYYKPESGKLRGDYYFYPAYYQSFAVRLYNFNGQSVEPQSTTVISFKEKVFPEGDTYKEITELKTFPRYEQAVDYINKQNSPNFKIVGTNPFTSPIPLQLLGDYKLIHSSKETVAQTGGGIIADVKVFEYKK